MKILVTGARGVTGQVLLPLLKQQKYTLLYPSHEELDLTQYHDVKKYFLDNTGIDWVIHLATAQPYYQEDTPAWGRKINADIQMATNLMHLSKKMLVVTSGSVYGDRDLIDVEEDEMSPLQPLSEMGWPKFVISNMAAVFDTIELRPFGLFAYNEPSSRLATYCMDRIYKGEPIVLKSNRLMSYIWVEDLCNIISKMIKDPPKERVFNVANPDPIKPTDVAGMLMEIIGKRVTVMVGNFGKTYMANVYRLNRTIDWTPTPHRVALAKMWERFKEEHEV